MGSSRLLLKYKSTTGHTVTQRESLYTHRAVFVNDVGTTMRERVELYPVSHTFAKIGKPRTHQYLQFGKGMDMQRSCTTQQAKS